VLAHFEHFNLTAVLGHFDWQLHPFFLDCFDRNFLAGDYVGCAVDYTELTLAEDFM
jgi:hypothetical protein